MPSYDYFVLDAFTRTRFTGNPAGVVLHDGSLTGEQMQAIAGELGLESAFLTPLTGGRGRLPSRLLHGRAAHPPVRP